MKVFLLALFSLALFAQDPRGFIRGTLTDTSGALIPGVKVRATANDTGVVSSPSPPSTKPMQPTVLV